MNAPACPKCGATLPKEGATCSRCLLDLAVEPPAENREEPAATGRRAPAASPPAPAELAPLFPELEIDSLLGAGGMGAVYKAKQKRLGREVALKVLHRDLSVDPVFVERFLREAQAMARLSHPGIVAVHDYGERAGRCFLMMEYVDGANLRALLKTGTLASRQALDIVRQLCDALQFAHDEGVVHRDIKPENVLVDTKGRVRVADFGLAKLMGAPASVSLTEAGQVMGTPHYMAPEQLEHPSDVDHRADLFSLGVVFYEMLTGELPLGRFAPPSQRVQIDVRLDEIVLKSLERERERRYQHAVQVKTDVERVERTPRERQWTRDEPMMRLRSGVYLPRLQAVLGGHRPAAWGWFALFTAAWIVCGASFNLGATWFLLISVPLLSWLFLSMVTARAGVEEQPDEELGRWVARMSPAAFLCAAIGFVVLFVAHVSSWERWTWSYVSSDQAPMAGLQRWRGEEDRLLRNVDLFADLSSSDLRLDAVSSHWLGSPYALLGLHPALLSALAGIVLLLGALITARVRGRPPKEWIAGVAGTLALSLVPLASLHALTFALSGGRPELEPVQASLECRGGEAHALGQTLRQVLVERELEVHAEHDARIVARWNDDELATVHVLAAGPASVFTRWRMSWGGPRRLEPHVLFTTISNSRNKHAAILADGGQVAGAQLASSEWLRQLRDTLRAACETPESK